MQISPHFHVDEFRCKDGTPVPRKAIPALKRLCEQFLEPLRKKFGPCHVTSGYRTRRYNARIGGARFSQHIYDESPDSVAADVVFARGTPSQWAREARAIRNRLGRGGVGEYPRSGFVHVDNRYERADWHQ